MPPRLTIVFPAHASGAELLRRSVMALRAQTAPSSVFEVVIGADGGDPHGVLAAAVADAARTDLGGQPVAVRIVSSARPRGDHPHRNHARNAGWQAAEGALCWMLDADFLAPPHGVTHVLCEADRCVAAGQLAVFTTCLGGVGDVGPVDWLARSAAWAASGSPAELADLLSRHSVDCGIFSGFPDQHVGGGEPTSVDLRTLPEGMPVVWKRLLEAMDGFDEEFGEWGADKEEFIYRLVGGRDAKLYDLRLITSVMPLHQPHDRDPEAWSRAAGRRQRERMRRTSLIHRRKAWWANKLAKMRIAMPAVIEAAQRM